MRTQSALFRPVSDESSHARTSEHGEPRSRLRRSIDETHDVRMLNDLIPVSVRIALRNAVGGWGPYSVREIDDLFNSHGFTDYDAQVPAVGGARRSTAEGYQTRIDFSDPDQVRRYLDLVDEVLDNYPEDADEPSAIGLKLRRELRRAGVSRGPSGRLELRALEAETARSLEHAAVGVWTPDRIRVFISHTSAHRAEVAAIAQGLDRFAFSCFVAHDAIEPSRSWQEVIELALRTCDVLLAYVTPDFNESRWCDQEVGWALGREIVVIPLKVEADPYGFFGTYQALRLSTLTPKMPGQHAIEIARAVAIAVFSEQRPGAGRLIPKMADLVVEAFCRSGSYDSTRRRWELLKLIPPSVWTEAHFIALETAARENSQVRDGVIETGHYEHRSTPELISELVQRERTRPR